MYNIIDAKFCLYIFITFIACVFYVLGTYYYELPNDNSSITIILVNSLLFGMIAALLRITSNKYLGKHMSVMLMEIIFLCLLFLATISYTLLLTNEKVYMHSYIIFTAIVALLVTNHYLNIAVSTQ
jgi:hypothetical protein